MSESREKLRQEMAKATTVERYVHMGSALQQTQMSIEELAENCRRLGKAIPTVESIGNMFPRSK